MKRLRKLERNLFYVSNWKQKAKKKEKKKQSVCGCVCGTQIHQTLSIFFYRCMNNKKNEGIPMDDISWTWMCKNFPKTFPNFQNDLYLFYSDWNESSNNLSNNSLVGTGRSISVFLLCISTHTQKTYFTQATRTELLLQIYLYLLRIHFVCNFIKIHESTITASECLGVSPEIFVPNPKETETQ